VQSREVDSTEESWRADMRSDKRKNHKIDMTMFGATQ